MSLLPSAASAANVRFSIVTVVLNDHSGLAATRNSLIHQSCQDFEWVVIDGLSTDGTAEMLKGWNDANLSWISERDRGLYDAMNKGLERAQGEYVSFLNAGDILAGSDVLARIDAALQQKPSCDLLYGDAYEIGANGEQLLKKARDIQTIRYGMFTHHQSMFYRRSFISDLRYTMNYKVAGDYEFTSAAYARGCTSRRVPFALCCFERGGISEQQAKRGREEVLMVQKKILHIGPVRRAMNRSAFWFSWFLKSNFRNVYDSLRFKKISVDS